MRYFSGNSSDDDRRKLLSWLAESHENERELFLMKDIYDAGLAPQLYEEAQTEDGWLKLQQAIAKAKKQKLTPASPVRLVHWTEHFRKYAAILVIGLISGLLLAYLYPLLRTNKENVDVIAGISEIVTGRGERVTVTLPDGSTVTMNSCSHLSYPADFGINSRELQFTGEAFFYVQTNPDMPFVVQTAGLNIKALGTAFNIRAYADEDVVETTLVTGLLTIENQQHQSIVTLQPNQVIKIPKILISTAQTGINKDNVDEADATVSETTSIKSEQQAVLLDKIDPTVYTSWKDDRWIIRSESLESLAKRMERRYDVSITFEDDESKKYIFSGTLQDYPLEQILEVIRLNAPIKYSVAGRAVTISKDAQLKHRFRHLIYSPE